MQRLRHRRFRKAAGALTYSLSAQWRGLTFAIGECENEPKSIVVDCRHCL